MMKFSFIAHCYYPSHDSSGRVHVCVYIYNIGSINKLRHLQLIKDGQPWRLYVHVYVC